MAIPKRFWKWIAGGVAVVLLAVVGAPFVYIHFIEGDPPPRISFADADKANAAAAATTLPGAGGNSTTTTSGSTGTSTATTSPPANATPLSGGIAGPWQATNTSLFGYRVKEKLFGQSAEAYGRTNTVTGNIVINGTTISSGTITVDLTTMKSDQSQRDGQFKGRIMDTSTFPTAKFVLTKPIDLGSVPADKQEISVTGTGTLTLKGTTKSVDIPMKARLNGNHIEVTGSLNVVFADWGIDNPSGGPAQTEDHGILEFLVVFQKGSSANAS
jgi:polyisoprenoid-binding protein YceI